MSSVDQEAPVTSRNLNRSSKDQEAPGTQGNRTIQASECQEAPSTTVDETTKTSEDQEAPQTSGNKNMMPLEPPVDQSTKTPEDQEVPGSSRTSEEVRLKSFAYLTLRFTTENVMYILKYLFQTNDFNCLLMTFNCNVT